MKILIKWGTRTFGAGNKSGWDIYCVSLFLFLQFISLSLGSLYPNRSDPWLFYAMFFTAVVGIVIPVLFIYAGNKYISKNDEFIADVFEDVAEVYKISIAHLEDSLKSYL